MSAPVTFSAYFCHAAKESPRTTTLYLVGVIALIATLATLNWGDGVNVIVGGSVAGAHVVVLALSYVHFRRDHPPVRVPMVGESGPSATHPLQKLMTFALLRAQADIRLEDKTAGDELSEILHLIRNDRSGVVYQCLLDGYITFVIPLKESYEGKAPHSFYTVIQATDAAEQYFAYDLLIFERKYELNRASNLYPSKIISPGLDKIFDVSSVHQVHINMDPPQE